MAVSFDLFGTLVAAEMPADSAAAVGDELAARGVDVPPDWADAYRERHVDAPEGAEVPLPAHVARALSSRGVSFEDSAVRRAVVAAFDPAVETRDGAREAVAAARDRGPVGICSNCSVPELVGRTLVRSAFDRREFDAVVSSVGCGWRKPAPEIFAVTAARLGVDPDALVHVGDDPRTDGGEPSETRRTSEDQRSSGSARFVESRSSSDRRSDGGIEAVGGTALLLGERTLEDVADDLAEGEPWR